MTDGGDVLAAESGSRDRTDHVGFANMDSTSCPEDEVYDRTVCNWRRLRGTNDPESREGVLRSSPSIVAPARFEGIHPDAEYKLVLSE